VKDDDKSENTKTKNHFDRMKKVTDTKIFLIFLIIGIVIVAPIFLSMRPAPESFVRNRSLERYEDMLFNYDIVRYPAAAEIQSPEQPGDIVIGMNVDSDYINFGSILGGGGTSKRQINLSTKDSGNYKIMLRAFGEISKFIKFSENDFVLSGKKSVYVIMDTAGQNPGNYTGEIDVLVQKSKSTFLKAILGY
jgi:hypothetical protein